MALKSLKREEVKIDLAVEQEQTPVEGNACATGDAELDRAVELDVLRRLDQGDVWAWAAVTVTVSWRGFSASSHLGCCSYHDENDFLQPGDYFDDLVQDALDDLNVQVAEAYEALKEREALV